MRARNQRDNYYIPSDLVLMHKEMIDNGSYDAANQIQKIAELYLICFEMENQEDFDFEEYFSDLDNHDTLHDDMLLKIKTTIQ